MYVCQEWFPKDGSRKYQQQDGFWMDELLINQIDILLKNIKNDWDFTIIISGSGEVRVGKSFMGFQIACYWAYQMEKIHGIKVPYSIKDNIVLEGKRLIEQGNFLGQNHKYSPLVYDEAGADLEGTKMMNQMTQDVLDYFRECGMYNMLNLLILPDYFVLPIGIALTRSICLIDVYYTVDEENMFQRGYFNFYSKRTKKLLYIKGKRERNYNAVKYDFNGHFTNFFPLDIDEYKKLKQETLSKRESRRRNKFQIQRDCCWFILNQEFGWTQEKIALRSEQLTGIFVTHQAISDGISHFKMENE